MNFLNYKVCIVVFIFFLRIFSFVFFLIKIKFSKNSLKKSNFLDIILLIEVRIMNLLKFFASY